MLQQVCIQINKILNPLFPSYCTFITTPRTQCSSWNSLDNRSRFRSSRSFNNSRGSLFDIALVDRSRGLDGASLFSGSVSRGRSLGGVDDRRPVDGRGGSLVDRGLGVTGLTQVWNFGYVTVQARGVGDCLGPAVRKSDLGRPSGSRTITMLVGSEVDEPGVVLDGVGGGEAGVLRLPGESAGAVARREEARRA
jgi:hypothetical protein